MKLHLLKQLILACTLVWSCTNTAHAALITTEFSELTGNQGTVDVQLILATGEKAEGFSLQFSEELFSDLSIIFSPLQWESLVFQPDNLLGSGLFDNFNSAGLISGSARIAFTYIGGALIDSSALPALNYELYNANFQVISSGTSTPAITSVPESSSFVLILLGLFALALHRRSRIARNRFHLAVNH